MPRLTDEQRRIRPILATTREMLDDNGVTITDFGPVWPYVEGLRLSQGRNKMTPDQLSKLCWVVRRAPREGMDTRLFTKEMIDKLLQMGKDEADDETYRKEGLSYIRKTFRHLHKTVERKKVQQRADRDGEEPIPDRQQLPLVASTDELARYENVTVEVNFLGPMNTVTGQEIAMRASRDRTGQSVIFTARGYRLFPDAGLNLSTKERINLVLPFQIFLQSAAVAMIGEEIPEPWNTATIDMIKRTDLRDRPSHWSCFELLKKASDRDGKVPIVALGAIRALTYGLITDSGVYKFAHTQLQKLGLLETMRRSFPWRQRIRDETVRDGPPPPPGEVDMTGEMKIALVTPQFRHHDEDTKMPHAEKKITRRNKGTEVQQFVGKDRDGRFVYRTKLDTYTATQFQIDELLRIQGRQRGAKEMLNVEAQAARDDGRLAEPEGNLRYSMGNEESEDSEDDDDDRTLDGNGGNGGANGGAGPGGAGAANAGAAGAGAANARAADAGAANAGAANAGAAGAGAAGAGAAGAGAANA